MLEMRKGREQGLEDLERSAGWRLEVARLGTVTPPAVSMAAARLRAGGRAELKIETKLESERAEKIARESRRGANLSAK